MALWELTDDGWAFNDPRESPRLLVRLAGHVAFIPLIPFVLLGAVLGFVWITAAIVVFTLPGGLIAAALLDLTLRDYAVVYAAAVGVLLAGLLAGFLCVLVGRIASRRRRTD